VTNERFDESWSLALTRQFLSTISSRTKLRRCLKLYWNVHCIRILYNYLVFSCIDCPANEILWRTMSLQWNKEDIFIIVVIRNFWNGKHVVIIMKKFRAWVCMSVFSRTITPQEARSLKTTASRQWSIERIKQIPKNKAIFVIQNMNKLRQTIETVMFFGFILKSFVAKFSFTVSLFFV
jgi:CRISPR/Cas system-associated endoribonuclease Cas2